MALSDREFRRNIIWNEISLVPQSAQASLNPVYRVGDQIIEAIDEHADMTAKAARRGWRNCSTSSGWSRALFRPIRTNSPAACANAP